MPDMQLPSFQELRRQYRPVDDAVLDEDPPLAISLTVALRSGHDPLAVLVYLQGFGLSVASLAELQAAIAALADEEELSAHPCQEGLAIVLAADNLWLLVRP